MATPSPPSFSTSGLVAPPPIPGTPFVSETFRLPLTRHVCKRTVVPTRHVLLPHTHLPRFPKATVKPRLISPKSPIATAHAHRASRGGRRAWDRAAGSRPG